MFIVRYILYYMFIPFQKWVFLLPFCTVKTSLFWRMNKTASLPDLIQVTAEGKQAHYFWLGNYITLWKKQKPMKRLFKDACLRDASELK